MALLGAGYGTRTRANSLEGCCAAVTPIPRVFQHNSRAATPAEQTAPRCTIDDRGLLSIESATIAVLTESGRVLHGASPERSPGARFSLSRSRDGHVVRLRQDVGEEMARAIERLVADEPPLDDPRSRPVHADDYARLLGVETPVEDAVAGPIYVFPERLDFEPPAPLVRSGTPEGDALVARLVAQGMPAAMRDMKFVDTGELWTPWCIALDGDEIGSVAFTVGHGPGSAEVGVATMRPFRGRGLASAATSGWATLPAIRDLHRFYSTSWSNDSSQRVTERLGLRLIGARFAIS